MIEKLVDTKSFIKDLENFCDANRHNQFIHSDWLQISSVSPAETYRAFIDYSFKNQLIKDLTTSHLESIQTYSPVAVFYLLYFLEYFLKNDQFNFDIAESFAKSVTKEPGIKETEEIISSFFENSSTLDSKSAIEIFRNNGFVSKFNIKSSNTQLLACVFDSGYQILGSLDKMIAENISSEENIYDCKIIVYDGFIQEISELNKILTFSNQESISFLIICRGCSEDVGYTCGINKKMKKADVNVFIPEPEFWKENSYDFCLSTNSFKFGFETGTLLNMVDKEKLFSCEIFIKQEGLFLKSDKLGINQEALTTFYVPERINNKLGIFEDQLNFFRSLTQQISLCGILSNDEFFENFNIDISNMTGLDNNFHPAFPVFRAFKEAKIVANKIINIGCLIKKSSNG